MHAKKSRKRVAILIAISALFIASSALAESFNYHNAPLGAFGQAETTGSAVRQYNKVWRPAGNLFYLGYYDHAVWDNTWTNPFESPSSDGISTIAYCANGTGSYVSPVTCQTTRP